MLFRSDPSSVVEIACKGEPVRKCTVSASLSDDRYPAVDYVVLPGSVTFKDDVVSWRIYKKKSIKKGYLSQTANLFVNLKSNTMKNTVQIYGLLSTLQIKQEKRDVL